MSSLLLHLVAVTLRGVLVVYFVLVVCHFVLQTVFAHLAYRRTRHALAAPDDGYRPSVDIIVPCYNETAEAIARCCEAILAQGYEGSITTWLVDDGSPNRDEVAGVYARYRSRLGWHVILPEANQGKRHAQSEAFRRGTADVIITIDSDTEIAPDGVRTLVRVFRDETVGAATGDVRAANRRANLLTRLIDMRYWVAFNQERAAQSFFGSVLCCSGPFAIYRRSVLDQVWNDYTTQTFRGIPCTYGDDRHLTNLVLASGYRTVFEPAATAITNVPTRMTTYLRQQLRWNKSFYRELLWTLTFLPRLGPYMMFEVVTQTLLPMLLVMSAAAAVTRGALISPSYLLRYVGTIAAVAIVHCLYAAYRNRSGEYLLFVVYGFLHAALLIPVRLRALATLTDNRWGTRRTATGGTTG